MRESPVCRVSVRPVRTSRPWQRKVLQEKAWGGASLQQADMPGLQDEEAVLQLPVLGEGRVFRRRGHSFKKGEVLSWLPEGRKYMQALEARKDLLEEEDKVVITKWIGTSYGE